MNLRNIALLVFVCFAHLACEQNTDHNPQNLTPLHRRVLEEGAWKILSLEERNRCVSGPGRVCAQWFSVETQFVGQHSLRQTEIDNAIVLSLACNDYDAEIFSSDDVTFQLKNFRFIDSRNCDARQQLENDLIYKYFLESKFQMDQAGDLFLKNQFGDILKLRALL
jgi:hypothetical protein